MNIKPVKQIFLWTSCAFNVLLILLFISWVLNRIPTDGNTKDEPTRSVTPTEGLLEVDDEATP